MKKLCQRCSIDKEQTEVKSMFQLIKLPTLYITSICKMDLHIGQFIKFSGKIVVNNLES